MKNKSKFYTGDLVYQGFTKKFISAEIYDGKKHFKFRKKSEFLKFILNLNSTLFFYDLDDAIRTIFEWCQEKKIKIDTSPFLSGDNRIIEWKIIKNTIFRDALSLLPENLKNLADSFGIKKEKRKNNTILFYKILKKFWDFVGWENFNKKSISSVALAKFKKIDKNAYNQIIEYPIYPENFDFIKKAYFSSYYHTFKEKFENKRKMIIKIDCNSFYGAIMRNNLFPWGYLSEHKNKKEILDHFEKDELGIIEARVKIPKGLPMGFLPVKRKEGIDYPIVGKTIKGVWTTPEIKYAQGLGYKFEFKKSVFWPFKTHLFRKYINYLARMKENSRGAKRTIAKFLLVSFYGKFAQRRELSFFKYTEKPLFDKMYLDRNLTLVEEKKYMRAPFSHPEISVFTTAYARIFIWGLCEKIGWEKIISIINDSLILEVEENFFKKFRAS